MEHRWGLNAPSAVDNSPTKTQKQCRHRQEVLRRFLAMSAMIGREYAPNFDRADPQGVH